MKRLKGFDYYEPTSLDEAITILSGALGSPQLLAGGTDLIVDLKIERLSPSTIVNLKKIPDLSGIELVEGGLKIGALTNVTEIETSVLVQHRHEALATAASILASPPVRALATIGGNVGRASPASDLGPALIVAGAWAEIAGRDGNRRELVEDLYAGPGATTLAKSDIITSFFLPDPSARCGSAHVKLGKRGSGTDIALAGVAVSVSIGEQGLVDECKIALASLGPTPLRALEAERALTGAAPTEETLGAVAEVAAGEARPIGDMRASAEYRTTLARVLTLRALRQAVAAAESEVTAS